VTHPPLSFDIPAVMAWRDAAIALYDVERDIARRQRSRHDIDHAILPRLIEKRARLLASVEPLRKAADLAEAAALDAYLAKPVTITITPREAADLDLDIPTFLRRRA
jgi:hypothetical protein